MKPLWCSGLESHEKDVEKIFHPSRSKILGGGLSNCVDHSSFNEKSATALWAFFIRIQLPLTSFLNEILVYSHVRVLTCVSILRYWISKFSSLDHLKIILFELLVQKLGNWFKLIGVCIGDCDEVFAEMLMTCDWDQASLKHERLRFFSRIYILGFMLFLMLLQTIFMM